MVKCFLLNPKKAGGSEFMYSLGGPFGAPPLLEKPLENIYRYKMPVYSPNFQGQLIKILDL